MHHSFDLLEAIVSPMTPRDLGIVPGLRWMLAHPRWSPWLPAVIMLIIPELLAICLEGRVANPFKQYLGVFPGDLFLSFALGASFWLAINHLKRGERPRWYRNRVWHAWAIMFSLGFAGLVFYGELQNTIHRYVPAAAYTPEQFVSPTNLFHYGIVAVMAYLLWTATLPALIHTPRRFWWLKVLIVLALLGWAICAMWLDNVLPRPDLADVHGEWFGGWWRNFG